MTTLGLFLRSLDNDYQQRLREEAVKLAKGLGFAVEIRSAQNDPARQVEQISAAIQRPTADRPAGILVSPVRDDTLEAVAREAASAGIDWVLLNRESTYVEELRRVFSGRAIFSVTPDQSEIGRIQGRQVLAMLPEGGRLLYVAGPAAASSAQRRLEALKDVLTTDYRLEVLHADWTSEGARMAVARWLEGQGAGAAIPDMCVAQNDEMALGVRQAVRDAASRFEQPGWGQLPITGCDGSPALGQRLVRERRLAATVAVPSATGAALEWIARARAGTEVPSEVVLPVSSFPEIDDLPPRARAA